MTEISILDSSLSESDMKVKAYRELKAACEELFASCEVHAQHVACSYMFTLCTCSQEAVTTAGDKYLSHVLQALGSLLPRVFITVAKPAGDRAPVLNAFSHLLCHS